MDCMIDERSVMEGNLFDFSTPIVFKIMRKICSTFSLNESMVSLVSRRYMRGENRESCIV